MKIHDFSHEKSILSTYIAQLRNVEKQKDRMRFRQNLCRIGEILGYELSKTLAYDCRDVTTPLGTKCCATQKDEVVICSILRAGLPLHNGLLHCFDDAENTFISAYRRHQEGSHEFDIVVEYLASPSIEGKVLVIADPMLATGSSIMAVFEALKKRGTPKSIHVVSVIGSTLGVENIADFFASYDSQMWIATVDDGLNDDKYIVPGLGDAGDLAFGEQL